MSSDHGVSSRLTPLGPGLTEARVDWLVGADAVEGRDYQLDKMLPFWSKTSDQDWHLVRRHNTHTQQDTGSKRQRRSEIVLTPLCLFNSFLSLQCEINMQGVSSSAYRPGRLSERKEAGLDRFIGWYVQTMKDEIEKEKKGGQ